MSAPRTRLGTYARELGVSTRTVRVMGGMEKLKQLTPEARQVLLFPTKVIHKRGISRFKWPAT